MSGKRKGGCAAATSGAVDVVSAVYAKKGGEAKSHEATAAKPYRVNEIFRSVQAEGANAGRAAVFVRFAGCNLDCRFCDTNHDPYVEMTAAEINAEVARLTRGDRNVLVVFTGGEPTLQLREDEVLGSDNPKAIETNGIVAPPSWIGWVTVSPKTRLSPKALRRACEVKCLYSLLPDEYYLSLVGIHAALYVQPLEANGVMNTADCMRFIGEHPQFRLSVQWHKLVNIR